MESAFNNNQSIINRLVFIILTMLFLVSSIFVNGCSNSTDSINTTYDDIISGRDGSFNGTDIPIGDTNNFQEDVTEYDSGIDVVDTIGSDIQNKDTYQDTYGVTDITDYDILADTADNEIIDVDSDAFFSDSEASDLEDGGVKFTSIPTAAVLYGNPGRITRPPLPGYERGYYPYEEAIKYDVLIVAQHLVKCVYWINPNWKDPDCFFRIKQGNPNVLILVYRMGPGAVQYVDKFGPQDLDWAWIKAEHGIGSTDRWTAIGVSSGEYLLNILYPVERMMYLGNQNWQNFWIENTIYDLGARWPGSDGTLADVMQYAISYSNSWCPESRWDDQTKTCSQRDYPIDYYENGSLKQEDWRRDLVRFVEDAVPRLKPYLLGLNVWRTHPTYRDNLNRIKPFLVMDEASFYWSPDWKLTPAERLKIWKGALDNLRLAEGYRLLSMNVFTPVKDTPLTDTTKRLDVEDLSGLRGWDALWFALTSFLLGYNFDSENPNGYFAFNASTNANEGVSYRDSYYVDEYDSLPNLGRPLGNAEELSNGLYLRSFELGWVLVNPTGEEKIFTPSKPVRIIQHDNFIDPQSVPLVGEVPIAPTHGVILLSN